MGGGTKKKFVDFVLCPIRVSGKLKIRRAIVRRRRRRRRRRLVPRTLPLADR